MAFSHVYDVTCKMLRKAARCDASEKTVARAFRQRKIYFHLFREKPDLEPQDVTDRLQFGKTHGKKSAASWVSKPDMVIDSKKFQVFLDGKARDL